MKIDPLDLAVDVMAWVMLTPYAIAEKSHKKSIRQLGLLLVLVWVPTWIITAIPVVLFMLIMVGWSLFQDA